MRPESVEMRSGHERCQTAGSPCGIDAPGVPQKNLVNHESKRARLKGRVQKRGKTVARKHLGHQEENTKRGCLCLPDDAKDPAPGIVSESTRECDARGEHRVAAARDRDLRAARRARPSALCSARNFVLIIVDTDRKIVRYVGSCYCTIPYITIPPPFKTGRLRHRQSGIRRRATHRAYAFNLPSIICRYIYVFVNP